MGVRGDEDDNGSDSGDSVGEYEEGRVFTAVGTSGMNLGQDVLGNRSTPACGGEAPTPACGGEAPSPSGINLVAALAAERQFKGA
ncbi:OLC1v1019387C1 [Oldenlandia corymbosa var. corymbosa]|uniref:OLC1v1019387C1 n=1 Tax=Oldenlandia corymbosa var. corymbosa TaxID=529605 RepID=A0AAV1EDX9_OLDCO|nr:OLC1v1019387C1 [Oldenlandia corymbosa var. corymbosa]